MSTAVTSLVVLCLICFNTLIHSLAERMAEFAPSRGL